MIPIIYLIGGATALFLTACSSQRKVGPETRSPSEPEFPLPDSPARSFSCRPNPPEPRTPSEAEIRAKLQGICPPPDGPFPTMGNRLFRFEPSSSSPLWETPWEADRASRFFNYEKEPKLNTNLQAEKFPVAQSRHGNYLITLETPEGLFHPTQRTAILQTIQELNEFQKIPIQRFRWLKTPQYCNNLPKQPDCTQRHSLVLSQSINQIPVMQTLAHEMGHGVHVKKFPFDRNWNILFRLLLGFKNYELVDDSNYVPCLPDSAGSPDYNDGEAFASSFAVYYLFADQLSAFIQNPAVPVEMQEMGKMIWSFMRERVFEGKVFTSNLRDPFSEESFSDLFSRNKGKEVVSLCSALQDEDDDVQWTAADTLLDLFWVNHTEALPALLAFRGEKPLLMSFITTELKKVFVEQPELLPDLLAATGNPNPKVRARAIHILPYKKEWSSVFYQATRDPDPEVRKNAEKRILEASHQEEAQNP